jgi:hypothetical protein
VGNDRTDGIAALIRQILALGYRVRWHLTGLYRPQALRGVPHTIFPINQGAINMMCCPGKDIIVSELQAIVEEAA